MSVWYNEPDPFAAAWLRNLIAAGHLPAAVVDERKIEEVQPHELEAFTQCHFFAGIGGWPYALRLAGWPDDRPVWTGSCPCQPFSGAGKREGAADSRHLWPHWLRLIRKQRPVTIFGEQVASGDGLAWLDLVSADLEAEDYAVGAADLCAAGVGAPHIRQRIYFVADAEKTRRGASWGSPSSGRTKVQPPGLRVAFAVANSERAGRPEGWAIAGNGSASGRGWISSVGDTDRKREGEIAGVRELTDTNGTRGSVGAVVHAAGEQEGIPGRARQPRSPWADAEWIACIDGKSRPVEPGTFPLAHGVPGRVGRLRTYGNAIVPQVAAAFVRAAQPLPPGEGGK